MRHKVSQVYMIILFQKNILEAIEFYKKLGLKVVFHIPEKWCELDLNGIKIGLCPATSIEDLPKNTGIVFQVENLQEMYTYLLTEGFHFLNSPLVATHGHMVTLKDPYGNIFDLYQPTHDYLKNTLDKELGCCVKKNIENNDQCCLIKN